jgi:nucleotide-binding universal stress UspA family protein
VRHGANLTVGYDASLCARRALAWAATTAAGHDATIHVIGCYGPPPAAEPWFGTVPLDASMIAEDVERELHAAVEPLRAAYPDVSFRREARIGSPARELVEQATGSDLLVVGTTGNGSFDTWRLGSVAHAVARRAPCPVALVPDVEPAAAPTGRVVVGVDGSPAATAAVSWACDEADDRDAELVVVHVWEYPYATELGSPTARDMTRVDASLLLEAAARHARDRRRGPVSDALVEGDTATELITQSQHADLIVLGTRGRNPLRAALFGSVSQRVSRNSACPTVVVRAPSRH